MVHLVKLRAGMSQRENIALEWWKKQPNTTTRARGVTALLVVIVAITVLSILKLQTCTSTKRSVPSSRLTKHDPVLHRPRQASRNFW